MDGGSGSNSSGRQASVQTVEEVKLGGGEDENLCRRALNPDRSQLGGYKIARALIENTTTTTAYSEQISMLQYEIFAMYR